MAMVIDTIQQAFSTPAQALSDRSTHWASREWVGQKLDRVGSVLKQRFKHDSPKNIDTPSNLQHLFKMETTKPLTIKHLTDPVQYKKIVATNFTNLNEGIQTKELFKGVDLKKLPKQLLIEDNIKPIHHLAKGDLNYLGSGLTRKAGLGLMTYDIAKETNQAYQEEGTQEAIKTAGKETLKNAGAWQAASVGYLFGKAALPSLGKLPIGGIISGTLSAMLIGYLLDNALD